MQKFLKNRNGQGLVEIILAMGIFTLVAASVISLVLGSNMAMQSSEEQTKAEYLAQEGIEAVRSIREEAWNKLTLSESAVATTTEGWDFTNEGDFETIGDFVRVINFEDVCRDVLDNITVCPGDYIDKHSKKVIVRVSWEVRPGVLNSVVRETYLTNWDSNNWVQTDWLGGSGQTIWSDETSYDWDDGNIDNLSFGEIKLKSISSAGGCGIRTWNFNTPSNYAYDSGKIEVISGKAQLISAGGSCSGTATECIAYSDQTNCETQSGCAWDEADCSGTPEICANLGSGDCDICGCSYSAGTGGTCSNNGSCRDVSRTLCDSACGVFGCYSRGNCRGTLDCSGATDEASCTNCSACLWTASPGTCSGTPSDCTVYTDEPSCNVCGCAWDLADCYGTADSCNVYSDQTNCETQSGCAWSGGSYPTDLPTIQPTSSHSVTNINQWTSFSETATKNGGEIYYQLSDDDGATWQYWDGVTWAVSGTNDYNIATEIDSNISSFSVATGKILYRAFLASDGTELVQLDAVSIGCVQYKDWDFDVVENYTYDSEKIEVVLSNAQLISGTGYCSGTATECISYLDQTNCETQSGCLWDQADCSGTPEICANLGSGDCDICGCSYSAGSGGTCSNNGSCRDVSRNLCDSACGVFGCYSRGNCRGTLDCSSATDETSCTTCSSCLWTAAPGTCSGTPSDCTVYTDESSCNVCGCAWDLADCYGTANSCNAYSDQINCETQSGCAWAGGSYPTDLPTIQPTTSHSVTNINQWTSFSETATKNGGEIYYQLSDDDGATWQYWDGSIWTTAGANNYNVATEIDSNINLFATTTEQILFKAFLASDGVGQIQLDNVRIGWGESTEVESGFATSGFLVSSVFDMGTSSAVQILDWDETLVVDSAIQVQIRTAPDNGGSPGTWSSWYGSGGAGTYFTNSDETLITEELNGNNWLQYRVELTGDGTDTPIFEEIRLNYK